MLLFQKRFHGGLVSGQVTLTFRRWPSCRVKPGGRYRCHPIGVLEVDEVGQVRVDAIVEADALRAGFASRDELVAYMRGASEEALDEGSLVWRIGLRHGGDGDRVQGALEDQLTSDDAQAISERLARLDGAKAWTRETLGLIDRMPRVAASRLAMTLGRETKPFKADVVKLKKLGLTQSFEVGYELSPRGRAYLAAAGNSAGGAARSAPSQRSSVVSKRPRAARAAGSPRARKKT